MSDHWQPAKLVMGQSMWDDSATTVTLGSDPPPATASSASATTAPTTGPLDSSPATMSVGSTADGTTTLSNDFETRAKELQPPFYKSFGAIDKQTIEWEKKHRAAKRQVRSTPEYKFVMLIAGAANQRIERLWTTPSEEPAAMGGKGAVSTAANESGDSFLTAAPNQDDYAQAQQFQHYWTQVPEVSLEIHLSPNVYFHVEQSMDLINKHPRYSKVKLGKLIRNTSVAVPLAELVALSMKFSSFMSGLNYQLDGNYKRLARERKIALFRVFAALKKSKSSSLT